jgi:hypothetical protein
MNREDYMDAIHTKLHIWISSDIHKHIQHSLLSILINFCEKKLVKQILYVT